MDNKKTQKAYVIWSVENEKYYKPNLTLTSEWEVRKLEWDALGQGSNVK